jgi:hypothetical protein
MRISRVVQAERYMNMPTSHSFWKALPTTISHSFWGQIERKKTKEFFDKEVPRFHAYQRLATFEHCDKIMCEAISREFVAWGIEDAKERKISSSEWLWQRSKQAYLGLSPNQKYGPQYAGRANRYREIRIKPVLTYLPSLGSSSASLSFWAEAI